MTPIRISLALMVVLLCQIEMAMAASVTLAFNGHFAGLRTDGGIPLPAGVNVGTQFSGTLTYDLGMASNLSFPLPTASAGVAFYGPSNLTLNLGGYHIQDYSSTAFFLDDALHSETHVIADVIFLAFQNSFGNYPLGANDHQLSLTWGDPTKTAMDTISLTEPLPADWRIPLELFDNLHFDIAVYKEIDINSAWPPYTDFYILEGQVDSVREVPLPAAGAMFALALVQLIVFRRRSP